MVITQDVQRSWLILNGIKGLGPVKINHLLEKFGSPDEVIKESAATIALLAGISQSAAEQIFDGNYLQSIDEQLKQADLQRIEILTIDHPAYPVQLKNIFAPPPVLYVKGRLDAFDKHAVAIVGTRRPSQYGKSAAAFVSRELAAQGIAIVSGLALGIDTEAHQRCLEQGTPTLAVLGCGLDTIYPAVNKRLSERIVDDGLLVSEFPLNTPPEAYNFPRRNRIISGLSAGVVVVEAAAKSGALITSHYAIQQNRDVFAVPGSIFSEKSAGTHMLIKNGATPVRDAADIIDAIRTITVSPPPAIDATPVQRLGMELLSTHEKTVCAALSAEPLRLDQLGEKCALSVGEIMSILLNLEIKGYVKQQAGQHFVRT
ncbi:MAG: DNA-protecting protein DprA [Chitinivibrionales bacterium]|nr:DNA-protecting protein DprA [Chitinivibrionales bacterium]